MNSLHPSQGRASPSEAAPEVPPQNLHAEEVVLGALLVQSALLGEVSLEPGDFYAERHGIIYATIRELERTGQPVDSISVAEALGEKEVARIGGLAYLSSLGDRIPTLRNVGYYAEIVRQKSALRTLIRVSRETVVEAHSEDLGPDNTEAFLDAAEAKIFAIRESQDTGDSAALLKAVNREIFHELEAFMARGEDMSLGVTTGLTDLDGMLCGLQPAQLIILAARPSMGKTSLALGMASAVAHGGTPVAFFSLEMGKHELGKRIACQWAGVSSRAFRERAVLERSFPRIMRATEETTAWPLMIDDAARLTPIMLRSKCRRLKRQMGGLGAVFVDYLQLMHPDTSLKGNRNQEISEISRSLKLLAKELQVPVIALSQLNRDCEKRPDKRPRMSDLRESGSLEQDADVVMFIYRDEVYHEETEERGIAELIVAKQRNGPTGVTRTRFERDSTRFLDLGVSSL